MGKKVRARLLYEQCSRKMASASAAYRATKSKSNFEAFQLASRHLRKAMKVYAALDAACPLLSAGVDQ